MTKNIDKYHVYTFANRFFQAQRQHLSDGVLRLGVHLRWTKLFRVLGVKNIYHFNIIQLANHGESYLLDLIFGRISEP